MNKQATRIQKGDVVDYTATSDILNGDVIPLVDRIGVALDNASTGEVISLSLEGVYEVAVKTADAISFGSKVYWDSATKEFTKTVGANIFAGISITEKTAGTDEPIYIKIG